MAIAFQEFDVEQFRAQITKMSDADLIKRGLSLRRLCYPRVVTAQKSAFDIKLEECRAEWRRRHPPAPRKV